jgi:hypothetical protein
MMLHDDDTAEAAVAATAEVDATLIMAAAVSERVVYVIYLHLRHLNSPPPFLTTPK